MRQSTQRLVYSLTHFWRPFLCFRGVFFFFFCPFELLLYKSSLYWRTTSDGTRTVIKTNFGISKNKKMTHNFLTMWIEKYHCVPYRRKRARMHALLVFKSSLWWHAYGIKTSFALSKDKKYPIISGQFSNKNYQCVSYRRELECMHSKWWLSKWDWSYTYNTIPLNDYQLLCH